MLVDQAIPATKPPKKKGQAKSFDLNVRSFCLEDDYFITPKNKKTITEI